MPVTVQSDVLDLVFKIKLENNNGNTSNVLMFGGKKVSRCDVDPMGCPNRKQ